MIALKMRVYPGKETEGKMVVNLDTGEERIPAAWVDEEAGEIGLLVGFPNCWGVHYDQAHHLFEVSEDPVYQYHEPDGTERYADDVYGALVRIVKGNFKLVDRPADEPRPITYTDAAGTSTQGI